MSILTWLMRILFYSNWFSKLAGNRIAGYAVPAILGLYYLTLDIWGDDWSIIADHKAFHLELYKYLVGASLIFIFLKVARDFYEDLTRTAKQDISKGLITLTSRIVKAKLDRFKDCAALLTPSSNAFKRITQPEAQIQVIISEIVTFLDHTFDLTDGELCITVMHCNVLTNKWHFLFNTHNGWTRTRAEKLVGEQSLAKLCLDRGEAVFHPDKIIAAKKSEYFLSERDNREKSGSAFGYPVVVNVNGTEYKFVISIITYGKMLCNVHSPDQVEAMKLTLRDICRRIELELTLLSMKRSQ